MSPDIKSYKCLFFFLEWQTEKIYITKKGGITPQRIQIMVQGNTQPRPINTPQRKKKARKKNKDSGAQPNPQDMPKEATNKHQARLL